MVKQQSQDFILLVLAPGLLALDHYTNAYSCRTYWSRGTSLSGGSHSLLGKRQNQM